MSLIETAAGINEWLAQADRKHKSLALVPTMGFLHAGHQSLIERAKRENDLVAVSVFVNPTQFAPGEDYKSYPRDTERDYRLATQAGADLVFFPAAEEIYGPGASTAVEVEGALTKKLCGVSRPTHFKGVTTVVNILFNLFRPDRAYFGQKDAQQAVIIKKMVRDLHMPLEVVVCPIVRETDGLALSSRNTYLNPEERRQATVLNRALEAAERSVRSGAEGCRGTALLARGIECAIREMPLAAIDYVQILDADTLEDIPAILPGKAALAAVAVRFGRTRLIDNRILSV